MYIITRKKTGGGFNVRPNARGSYQKLMRNKNAGYGIGAELFDNIDRGGDDRKNKNDIQHLTQKMNHLTIKPSRQRKYISLNL